MDVDELLKGTDRWVTTLQTLDAELDEAVTDDDRKPIEVLQAARSVLEVLATRKPLTESLVAELHEHLEEDLFRAIERFDSFLQEQRIWNGDGSALIPTGRAAFHKCNRAVDSLEDVVEDLRSVSIKNEPERIIVLGIVTEDHVEGGDPWLYWRDNIPEDKRNDLAIALERLRDGFLDVTIGIQQAIWKSFEELVDAEKKKLVEKLSDDDPEPYELKKAQERMLLAGSAAPEKRLLLLRDAWDYLRRRARLLRHQNVEEPDLFERARTLLCLAVNFESNGLSDRANELREKAEALIEDEDEFEALLAEVAEELDAAEA